VQPTAKSEPWARAARALLTTGVFLAGCLLWARALGAISAVFLLLVGQQAATTEQFIELLGGMGFAFLSILQILGFAGVAFTLALLVARDGSFPRPGTGRPELSDRLARSFPMRPQLAQSAVALLGGLTVWLFPSWVAQWLTDRLDYTSTPELLTDLLVSGPWLDRVAVGFAILGTAPLLEELIYRGFLWRVTAQGFGWLGALSITTALFALSHLDPVQSTALLPTALFLGWMRYTSGSLWPPLVGHLTNNGVGVLLTLVALDAEARVPLWAALLGLLLTLGWAAVAELLRRRDRLHGQAGR
jgi:membrane protease YdiL (CAAX protease family)